MSSGCSQPRWYSASHKRAFLEMTHVQMLLSGHTAKSDLPQFTTRNNPFLPPVKDGEEILRHEFSRMRSDM